MFDAKAEQLRKSRAQSARAGLLLLALPPLRQIFLGSGAVADSACTMMPVTRQPPASLIAWVLVDAARDLPAVAVHRSHHRVVPRVSGRATGTYRERPQQ